MTSTTTLATVPGAALQLATGTAKVSLADLADAVVPVTDEPKVPDFPALPKAVELTSDARAALLNVSAVFGQFQLGERRELTADELALITRENKVISDILTPLSDRAGVISEMIRVHMDVEAERQHGKAGTAIRKAARILGGKFKGHYLLATKGRPHKVEVNGFENSWEQRYTDGGTDIRPDLLPQLAKDGKITHEEYLALTRSARAWAEDRVARFIEANPERGLEILAAITVRKDPGAQLVSPKR
jgi:hypothetical protein